MITNVTLSTKEQLLLQDQKSHEEQCILKYDNYSNLASDPELKTLFKNNAQKEREHLQTINQLLSGQVPSATGQSSSNSQQSGQQSSGQQSGQQVAGQQPSGQQKANWNMSQQESKEKSGVTSFHITEKDMCIDMLNTEKYVSGTYDTTIFECKNTHVRDVLNHIQKDEQKHGEAIFVYMQSKGMYSS
ncbi:MAG TPA: spore coat protein [Clostridiales bacterium]|jgi:spore coat protein CotF|nr:spore coat protein [Clostridiales bacterium]